MAFRFLFEDNTTASTNLTPASGPEAIYALKRLLKAAGWTVTRSSDGTTYNASADIITSGLSGAGGLGNNNAWFVLQAPAGGRQIVIQRGTSNINWAAHYSKAAGFTGGSPTATVRSTATDEQALLGAGTGTFAQLLPTDGSYRFSCGADSASPYGFYAFAVSTGGANSHTMILFDPMTSGVAEDADPYVLAFTYHATSNWMDTGGTSGITSAASSSTCPKGYLKFGLAGEGFVKLPALTYCHRSSSGGSLVMSFPEGAPTDPHNSKDQVAPVIWHRPSAETAPAGFKGVSTVCKMNCVDRSNLDVLNLVGTKDRVVVGHFNLPWDGSTPTI